MKKLLVWRNMLFSNKRKKCFDQIFHLKWKKNNLLCFAGIPLCMCTDVIITETLITKIYWNGTLSSDAVIVNFFSIWLNFLYNFNFSYCATHSNACGDSAIFHKREQFTSFFTFSNIQTLYLTCTVVITTAHFISTLFHYW